MGLRAFGRAAPATCGGPLGRPETAVYGLGFWIWGFVFRVFERVRLVLFFPEPLRGTLQGLVWEAFRGWVFGYLGGLSRISDPGDSSVFLFYRASWGLSKPMKTAKRDPCQNRSHSFSLNSDNSKPNIDPKL